MKLFGSKKKNRSSRPAKDNAALDETRVIPAGNSKIKAFLAASKVDKKRAAVVSIWAAAAVLLLILIVSVGSRIGEKSPENSEKPVLKGETDAAKENRTDDNSSPDVILPLNPSVPEDTEMMAVPYGENEEENIRNADYRNFLFAVYDKKGISVDTVILGRLDTAKGELDIVNIPRDTLVNVSWDLKRLSTVMLNENKDAQRFLNEISSILGFSLDYYAFIEAKTVADLIDAMGGIYYTVPRNMNYDDDASGAHVNISTGLQWLNGTKALQMLKFRIGNNGSGYPNGELGRIETVQDFLLTVFRLFAEKGEVVNETELINIILEESDGNLSEECLRSFCEMLPEMNEENVRFATMPGENVRIKSTVYYEISAVEWAEMVNEYLNPYEKEVVLHNLDILMFDASAETVMSTCGEMIDYNSFQ